MGAPQFKLSLSLSTQKSTRTYCACLLLPFSLPSHHDQAVRACRLFFLAPPSAQRVWRCPGQTLSTSSCQCMRQPWFSTATWFLRSLSCSLLGWSTALTIQSRMSPLSKQPWMGKHCLGLQLVQSPIPSRNSSQLSLVVAQQRYGALLQQRRHFSGLRSSRSPTGYTRYHLSCKVWILHLDPKFWWFFWQREVRLTWTHSF